MVTKAPDAPLDMAGLADAQAAGAIIEVKCNDEAI